MIRKIITAIVLLLALTQAEAVQVGFIAPPVQVLEMARELEYSDFPKAVDIISIARIESGFNPNASNAISYGIMQVNNGSLDVVENMKQGTQLLRQYFVMTRSTSGAVMAYNVGIGNYFRSRLRGSQLEYYSKFNQARRLYESTYNKWVAVRNPNWYWVSAVDYCSNTDLNVLPGQTCCVFLTLYGLSRSSVRSSRLLSGVKIKYRPVA